MKPIWILFLGMAGVAFAVDWPHWRGPLANGFAPTATPPLSWSETNNVRWKIEVPGRGMSSPVVWDDTIYLTTVIPTERPAGPDAATEEPPEWLRREARRPTVVHQFVVLALNRADGSVRWQTVVTEQVPQAPTHPDGSWASGSPVTDGERVYVSFGSQGVYCLDRTGKVLWEKQLGRLRVRATFGEGISPVLHGDSVLLLWDHEGTSFLVALDKRTGAEQWRVERDEMTSWATPFLASHDGQTQIVVSATQRVRGYEATTGRLLWETPGMTTNTIPMPVQLDGKVMVMSGFRGAAAVAVRLANATGDLTGKPDAFAWKLDRDRPYVASPVLVGDQLYFLKVLEGSLACVNARTGEFHYRGQTLAGTRKVYASLVAAGDRVYVTGTEGWRHVIRAGAEFAVLAANKLDDKFTASPALAGTDLLLRGERHLYCLADTTP